MQRLVIMEGPPEAMPDMGRLNIFECKVGVQDLDFLLQPVWEENVR